MLLAPALVKLLSHINPNWALAFVLFSIVIFCDSTLNCIKFTRFPQKEQNSIQNKAFLFYYEQEP